MGKTKEIVHHTTGGIGFTGLLFITFLVLKLTEVIDWSWWWVTAPLWGGLALVILIVVLVGGIGAAVLCLVLLWKWLAGRKEKKEAEKRMEALRDQIKADQRNAGIGT